MIYSVYGHARGEVSPDFPPYPGTDSPSASLSPHLILTQVS